MEKQRNGVAVYDSNRRRVFDAAVEQLRRALELKQNCQVVYNIGRDAFGMGNYTRGNAENCLFAVRGRPKRMCAGVSQMIVAQVGRHSEKPAEARDRLVRLMGDVPRIELFARTTAPGWDSWGNEVDSVDLWSRNGDEFKI